MTAGPRIHFCGGFVHHGDRVARTRRCIATADPLVRACNIATGCGMGRRPPETVHPLLRIHAEAAAASLAPAR
jgi:hypothetical protein